MAAQQLEHIPPHAHEHPDDGNICFKNIAETSCEDQSCYSMLSTLVHPARRPATDKEALDLIERLTCHADQVQSLTLAAILQRNANTEYLLKFGLQGRRDCASFKSLLPVITYEDLQPEIQRIANGDTSPILSAFPISEFLASSGTSAGERKLIPTTHDESERRCLLYSFLMPIMNQYVPDLDKGKGMYFHFIMSEVKTPGGLLACPVLTSFFKSHWFIERPYNPYNVCTSPNETILCADSFQSMYCQMLCGLLQRDEVLRMGAVFASGFLRVIRFLQEHWRQLCNDIRTGEVSDVITDEPARKAVCRLLAGVASELKGSQRQREELAESIACACAGCEERASWKGIIPLVWPHTKYIDVIVTGAMAQYIPTLDMYSGGLPLVCTVYASSECYFGVNMQPLCKPSEVAYTLIPNMAYFEFLPVNDRESQLGTGRLSQQQEKELVELVDVEVGHEYEVVVTTYAGLYRYRVGDILRVTGFHNKAPQVQFVCRKNVALSIDSDKTDEETLHRAIEAATSTHLKDGVKLLDYTSYADLSTIPGHYVLFWELVDYSSKSSSSSDQELVATMQDEEVKRALERCCLEIEERLDYVYRQGRASDKSIGPLEIRVVRPHSFEALMDYNCLSRGASINQYKTPRFIKVLPIIELMDSRAISSFCSPRCPAWHR